MAIPLKLASDWDKFMTDWCMNNEPEQDREAVERALNTVAQLWPDQLDRVITGPGRGLAMIAPLIHLGLLLEECADIPGFDRLLRRAQGGERSAVSEMRFAARAKARDLPVELEPPLNGKVLDTLLTFEGEQIYCEVIAPETSAAMKQAHKLAGELATAIADRCPGKRVEVLIKGDLDETVCAKLLEVTPRLTLSGEIIDVDNLALASIHPSATDGIASTIPRGDAFAILSVAHLRQDETSKAVAIVHVPTSDERIKQLLYGESHHFTRKQMNILAIDVTQVPGGIKGWLPRIERCLQPTQNRRFGAVLLFMTTLEGEKASHTQTWRAVINPHAYRLIPAGLISVLIN